VGHYPLLPILHVQYFSKGDTGIAYERIMPGLGVGQKNLLEGCNIFHPLMGPWPPWLHTCTCKQFCQFGEWEETNYRY